MCVYASMVTSCPSCPTSRSNGVVLSSTKRGSSVTSLGYYNCGLGLRCTVMSGYAILSTTRVNPTG